MFRALKKKIYFFVAYYFRFFAQIQLNLWKPKIIVVTGSSGKTSLLHLIESQLKQNARYSHHANSTFGIAFDILGLRRKKLVLTEWICLFLAAPFKAFKKPYSEKIYIAEVDCDRPGEGKFLASLLKPEVTLWTNVSDTHSVNFDHLVTKNKFANVEQAIAYEFGYLLAKTTKCAVVKDQKEISEELKRTKAAIKKVSDNFLEKYEISKNGTDYRIQGSNYHFFQLLPKEFSSSIVMAKELCEYLNFEFGNSFSSFILPPGRSSIFQGIKNTTIIDSSYNATPDGVAAILNMFKQYPSDSKWLILGDMIELGEEEKLEHEKLAELINSIDASRIVLVGPRISKFTYPKLKSLNIVSKFDMPKPALEYIQSNLQGQETLLFKGARFLEGIIEHLLINKSDAEKLCRRELVWQKRRKAWGL